MDATAWSHETLAALADEAVAGRGPRRLAGRACELVTSAGAAEHVCVITLAPPETFATLAASDDLAERLGAWEAGHREGPSIDACRRALPVLVPLLDDRSRRRWPSYTVRAARAGVRSLWSVPMLAGDRCAGAIEGHAGAARSASPASVREVGGLGTLMAVLLLGWEDYRRAAGQADRLQEALRHSILVEQAKGRLAERHHITVGAAFEVLAAHAATRGAPLHEVARDVVEGRLLS